MNRLNGMALAGLCFVLSGCATVINGTSQDFSINTDPGGARARLSTGTECVTPCEVSLKRRHDVRIDFTKEGYEPAYVLVQSKLGGAIAGNILLGGLIGTGVDAASGASNHLEPQPLNLRLARLSSGEEPVLLNKDGQVDVTLAAHNDKVRADVAETLGVDAAGVNSGAGGSD